MKNIKENSFVKIDKNVRIARFEKGAIVLHIQTFQYYFLDEYALFILDTVNEMSSVKNIILAMKSAFEISSPENDVLFFLSFLLKKKIIKVY